MASPTAPPSAEILPPSPLSVESGDRRETFAERLERARCEARLSEAAWRRKEAQVARLIAAGKEAAADRLVAGVERRPRRTHVAQAPTPSVEPSIADPSAVIAPLATTDSVTESDPVSKRGSVSGRRSVSKRGSVAARDVAARDVAPSIESTPTAKVGRLLPAEPSPASAKRAKPSKRQAKAQPKRSRPNEQPANAQPANEPKPLPREAIRRRNRLSLGTLGTLHEWTSRQPPWALSLTAHGVLLIALALLSFAAWSEAPITLTAAFASESDTADLVPESMPAVQIDTTVDATLDGPIEETLVELAMLVEADVQPAPLELTPVSLVGDLLASDASGLMDAVPAAAANEAATDSAERASAESSSPKSELEPATGHSPGGVRFFGAEDVASRVAFVVDNSGSMQRGRMETTLMELDRAVHRLKPEQSFYVVLFSDQAYPMFYPQAADEMLPATRQNKTRLSKWLTTVEMCLGGRLLDAVELAAAMEPEVVYLLTDGDIRSQRVVGRLADAESWEFSIHTLGMGVRTPQDASKLQAIAAANSGVFRPVRAHPAAIRRAQLRPMPYHNTPGGKTWGSLIRSWKD
ncbi:MAG: VWA domain-containing protein [Planctomycetota bacterium]